MSKIIYIAAACITDSDNRLLVVRKKGSAIFMQPGGKIERSEQPLETLVREIKEELDIDLPIHLANYVGSFEAPAANESGYQVKAELFRVKLTQRLEVYPCAEIEEVRWITAKDVDHINMAPLMHKYVLPLWLP